MADVAATLQLPKILNRGQLNRLKQLRSVAQRARRSPGDLAGTTPSSMGPLPRRSVFPQSNRGRAQAPETYLELYRRRQSESKPLVLSPKRPWCRHSRSERPDKVILWFAEVDQSQHLGSTMQTIRPNIDHCQTLAERWSAQLRLCIAKRLERWSRGVY